jgi:hypothetical protein
VGNRHLRVPNRRSEYDFDNLLVTENGAAYDAEPVGGVVLDEPRRQ